MALPKLHLLPPHGCIHSQSTSVVAAALCSETIDEYPLLCLPTVPVICTRENKTSLVMEHGSKVCLLV